MTNEIRELIYRVWGGASDMHAILTKMHYLDSMFPRDKLEPALRYLVRQGITGDRFVDWYGTKCFGSDLEMHRELMRVVETDLMLRPLTFRDLRA